MDSQTESEASSSRGLFGNLKHSWGKLFKRDGDQDLQDLIESREEEEPLTEEEKMLITSVLEFGSITAGDACVPRSDIVYLSRKGDYKTVVNMFKETGYSRLPVCGKDLDEVVGFVTLKDMIQYFGEEETFELKRVMRPCTFVPESLSIPSVLDEMRNRTVQVAIVVDEYGGTEGLITVKDIMEELVGDLDDENEQENSSYNVVELVGGRLQLDARMEIEDMDEKLIDLLGASDEEDYETLGGFVLDFCGKVPVEGEQLELPTGSTLIVTKSDGRRIQKLTLIPVGTVSKAG